MIGGVSRTVSHRSNKNSSTMAEEDPIAVTTQPGPASPRKQIEKFVNDLDPHRVLGEEYDKASYNYKSID